MMIGYTFGASELDRSQSCSWFQMDVVDSGSEVNLLSSELGSKILVEFPLARIKSATGIRLLGFAGSESHQVKGSQTIFLDMWFFC